MKCIICGREAVSIISMTDTEVKDVEVCMNCNLLPRNELCEKVLEARSSWNEHRVMLYLLEKAQTKYELYRGGSFNPFPSDDAVVWNSICNEIYGYHKLLPFVQHMEQMMMMHLYHKGKFPAMMHRAHHYNAILRYADQNGFRFLDRQYHVHESVIGSIIAPGKILRMGAAR